MTKHPILCCGPCGDPEPLGYIASDDPPASSATWGYLCAACGIAYRGALVEDGQPTGKPPTRAQYDKHVQARRPDLYRPRPAPPDHPTPDTKGKP